MAEKMVRCIRCHEVFDADAGPCTKCGTPYQPPVAQPRAYEGLYVERYAGTALTPTDDSLIVVVPPRRHDNTSLFIGGGAVLIVSAIVVAVLAMSGALGGPNPTAQPRRVIAVTAPPSPTPTLPPTISKTLAQLNDAKLSAQITVDSHITMSATVGQSAAVIVKFDGNVSNGNEWGTLQAAGITQEIRLVEGRVYSRVMPAGKWILSAAMPSYLVVCPVFGLKSAEDIQLIGLESRGDQQLYHVQSTRSWSPDMNRLAMADLSFLPYWPDKSVLDLWVTADGTPVEATFSGWSLASDGTKLVDVEVAYTFKQVGVPQSIDVPGASPSASASHQA